MTPYIMQKMQLNRYTKKSYSTYFSNCIFTIITLMKFKYIFLQEIYSRTFDFFGFFQCEILAKRAGDKKQKVTVKNGKHHLTFLLRQNFAKASPFRNFKITC